MTNFKFLAAMTIVAGQFILPSTAFSQSVPSSPSIERVPVVLVPGNWWCLNNSSPACNNPPSNYDPEAELERGSWWCINNSSAACGTPSGAYQATNGVLEPGNWNCVNNGSLACKR